MGVEKIAQKAAEKLAVLAAMTDEQREQYRQQRNNTYFRLAVSTLDFIFEMDEQDQIALLRAAYTYNKTGKTTEFKSKSVNSAFNHVIKPQLDIDFDNYCIACYTTEENGRKGASALNGPGSTSIGKVPPEPATCMIRMMTASALPMTLKVIVSE